MLAKKDAKEFFSKNKETIKYVATLTASGIGILGMLYSVYFVGYADGVRKLSDDFCKVLGYEKYLPLKKQVISMLDERIKSK